MSWSDPNTPTARRRRRAVNRLWAWATLCSIPVLLGLAGTLIVTDRRPPALVKVAPGSSQLTLDEKIRRTVVRDSSLYVTPASAVATADCYYPKVNGGREPILHSRPDRANTATRVHQGVTYTYYGVVYALSDKVICSPQVTGLLMTEYDGDHLGRNFAFFLLLAMPVLAVIAVVILRRRPGSETP